MHSHLGLFFLALGGVLAAPLDAFPSLEQRIQPCLAHYSYKVKSEKIKIEPPRLVTGFRCTSLKNAQCSLTHGASFTKTTSSSATAGLSGALDLGKIFELGVDAGFSFDWSTSEATDTSSTVNCPKGEFECGLQARSTVIVTKGTVKKYWVGDDCFGEKPVNGKYTVVAPRTVPHVPKNQAAIVDFKACYIKCHGNKCKEAKRIGLPKCPKK